MDKIQIVNFLLTRRCNLKCDYCRIIKNYKAKPMDYPNMKYYKDNEVKTDAVIRFLEKLKKHNPNAFVIWYGGEPFLREDLPEIINYCNENEIPYTIISNNTKKIKPMIDQLLNKVSYISGFTASVDPIMFEVNKYMKDSYKKSISGLGGLLDYQGKIKDLVAEITVTRDNLHYLYPLVKVLTNCEINSDITFVDISKSRYYDFSNVEDDSILVPKNQEVRDILDTLISEKLNIHMRDTLLDKIYEILPSDLDCGIDKDIHNICVDADGSIRLCLRIRGTISPYSVNIENIFNEENNVNKILKDCIINDKSLYCKKCNHSCYLMSKMISENEDSSNSLIHSDVRKE